MNPLSYWKVLIFTALSLLITVTAFGAEKSRVFQAQEGIAINGYDTVAYFEQNGPPKRCTRIQRGVEWSNLVICFC